MARPHPTDLGFAAAYSQAWSDAPGPLLPYFSADAIYTDVAMGNSYTGHDEIGRFCRFMVRFAPDSHIEFGDTDARDGRLYAEWIWSGRIASPLKLRSGAVVDLGDADFSVSGVALCRYGEDGSLTSHRDFWDLATLLDQAGVTIS